MKTDKELSKNLFIEILKYSKRDGVDKMIKMLERTDFFTAPASTKFHGNKEGGLVEHCLLVFKLLIDAISLKAFNIGLPIFDIAKKVKEGSQLLLAEDNEGIDERAMLDKVVAKVMGDKVTFDSIVICTLLHDCHKINCYESYEKSVFGGYDDNGKKIWNTELAYKKRDDALVYGEPGANSNYIISSCINLSYEEKLAIENHHGFTSRGFSSESASAAWSISKLAIYLHLADMEAAYAFNL